MLHERRGHGEKGTGRLHSPVDGLRELLVGHEVPPSLGLDTSRKHAIHEVEVVALLQLQGPPHVPHALALDVVQGPNVKVFQFEMEDWPLFRDDFIDPVDTLCDVLLDYSDVDYFDAEKCRPLHGWLVERLGKPIVPRLELLYRKLDEFALRPIELGTGVVVEF